MPGDYPSYHSLVHKLAAKILTRSIKDGVGLADAIKDTIHYAELNRQQVIHLCAVLQEYGQPYPGDPMDFFYMPEDMGKAFPNTPNGYVVYANQKSLRPVFETINELKKSGFTSAEIVGMNPELGDVIDTMDQVDGFVDEKRGSEDLEFKKLYAQQLNALSPYFDNVEKTLNSLENEVSAAEGETMVDEQIAASDRMRNVRRAQQADIEEATPENLEALLDSENADAPSEEALPSDSGEDFEVSEDTGEDTGDLGDLGGDDTGGSISVTVTNTPSILQDQLSKTPKWSIDNILSIQAAENYLEGVRKKMEDIVFDENIMLDEGSIKQYDQVRAAIDEELEKIKNAQKETGKLEEKQNDLEEEFEVSDSQDVPTEELINEPPAEEAMVEEDAAPTEEIQVGE